MPCDVWTGRGGTSDQRAHGATEAGPAHFQTQDKISQGARHRKIVASLPIGRHAGISIPRRLAAIPLRVVTKVLRKRFRRKRGECIEGRRRLRKQPDGQITSFAA